ncbi:TetR/AcrR family transcriptional regulator [Solirubrobacter soli]|uniref:TetR/AcrR family transcriptional regulator n=1 Tax=Solirubrobacter soli TaxID=363832 RepID=UPI00040AEB6E|nr:TetR/AcrR family transcriptional regulator [Solirubrobacter soli]
MTDRPAPRDRLLEAADELFYSEGVCTVGVDRVLKQADVARASLYTTFGSKEELVRAYLQRRSDRWQALVAEVLPSRWDTPRDRILGVFELLTEWFEAPGYNGCPFINASAEASASAAVEEVRDAHRAWVRELFSGLGREAGAKDPRALSDQLVLLYDGSMVGAQLDHSAAPGIAARAAAGALVDAAL